MSAIIETTPASEIVTAREFNFPINLLFKAWADPVH